MEVIDAIVIYPIIGTKKMKNGENKISSVAKAGNVLGVLTLLIYVFFIRFTYGVEYLIPRYISVLFLASITLVLGIWAYIRIRRSKGEISGQNLAILSIVEGVIFLIIGYYDILSLINTLS